MKTRYLYILSALLLTACAQELPEEPITQQEPETQELIPDGFQRMTFAAEAEETATKTTLGTDFSIHWSSSDAISLFATTGAAGERFSVATTTDEGRKATFSGLSPETSNGYYYAVYPYSADARLVATSGTVQAALPTVQTGVQDSFAANASLAVACVNTEAADAESILRFRNVGALLSFTVPGNYLNKVRIASRDGSVAMTGPANIRYNDGEPVVSPTTASKNYVEVTFPQGTIGKVFYAVVYPGNYSQGFELTFFNSGNSYNRYTSTKPLNLKRNANVRLASKNWGTNDDRASSESGTELIAPTISSGGQASATSATITFSCGSGKRDTYKFYLRDASSMGEGTLVDSNHTGSGQYGSYSYTFNGLTTGGCYDLGVSAACVDESGYGDSPITWLEDVAINAEVSSLSVTVTSTAENYYDFIVNYKIEGLTSTGSEHGVLFSYTNPMPTCGNSTANKLPGPVFTSTGTVTATQCIPNSVLRPGEKCYVRAYCFAEDAGNYVYSPIQELTLPEQPGGFSITTSAKTSPNSAVTIRSFTAGGSYKGYYAAADVSSSSSVRLGVNNAPMGSSSAISMSSQLSSSGALVLLNGQIFGTQGNIGLAYVNGNLRYNNSSSDGISACRGYSNSYTTTWQPVTRAILGVDASGNPGAYWCSLIDNTPYFFNRPIPAGTAGSLVYPQVTAGNAVPGPKQSWSPAWALSTGPMLLYAGNVCVSEDKISNGVYYTNYELWETSSGNIYGSSRSRSAIGYNSSDGKFYLVVVTSNVTMTQLARIMKGIGCDYAMNLDGGQSAQMYVKGTGELTGNSRAVKSTIGFFAR